MFFSVNAGSLGALKRGRDREPPRRGARRSPTRTTTARGAGWASLVALGRSRTTRTDLRIRTRPRQEFPEAAALDDSMGWAPSYGASSRSSPHATHSRRRRDDVVASAMQDHGITTYDDEFRVSNSVLTGNWPPASLTTTTRFEFQSGPSEVRPVLRWQPPCQRWRTRNAGRHMA